MLGPFATASRRTPIHQVSQSSRCWLMLALIARCVGVRACVRVKASVRRGTWPTSKWNGRRLATGTRSRAAGGCRRKRTTGRSVASSPAPTCRRRAPKTNSVSRKAGIPRDRHGHRHRHADILARIFARMSACPATSPFSSPRAGHARRSSPTCPTT